MQTKRFKFIAAVCVVVLAAAGFCFAQTESDTAASPDNQADESQTVSAQNQGDQEGEKPAPGNAAPSLGDLGFTPGQIAGSPEEQARLDKRTHMLKIHQRLGLITTAPMLAALFTSSGAKGRSTSSAGRDLHTALGAATADLYFTTAYFSLFAPKGPETKSRGQIRLHKALAWIHGPGMILTPTLGILAFQQLSHGERIHGLAKLHAPVAWTTAAAYGTAILSVSLKF
jgi:hypothetical protein